MLTVKEDNWTVQTEGPVHDGKFIAVVVKKPLTQFEALRLAKALEMASDHLATT